MAELNWTVTFIWAKYCGIGIASAARAYIHSA